MFYTGSNVPISFDNIPEAMFRYYEKNKNPGAVTKNNFTYGIRKYFHSFCGIKNSNYKKRKRKKNIHLTSKYVFHINSGVINKFLKQEKYSQRNKSGNKNCNPCSRGKVCGKNTNAICDNVGNH